MLLSQQLLWLLLTMKKEEELQPLLLLKVVKDELNQLAVLPRQLWSNWVGNVTVPAGEATADRPGSIGWMYVI